MARAGRKRKSGVREPNGRLQRPKDFRDLKAEEAMAPMIEARARVHHLNLTQAGDPKAETVIGRWCLRGEISNRQWQAADQYLKEAKAYSWAVGSPKGARASALDTVGGAAIAEETEYEAERANRARERYADALTVIVGVELDHSGVSTALSEVILRDQDLPDEVGLVRLGLNALARHYQIPEP